MTSRLKSFLRPSVRPEQLRERTLAVGLGAMKAGTTWLSLYLRSLPEFLHSPVNELNFFNRLHEDPTRVRDESYRALQMETIILDKPLKLPRHWDKLRALAQQGRMATIDDYLAFFAERMGRQTHFGEISPAYSHLPAETLREIAAITKDVRFLFIMRDPAKRAASHIRHLRRRRQAHVPIDTLVEEVGEGNNVWMRSDYGLTADALKAAGVLDRTRFLYSETLFRPQTIRDLCAWLGLDYRKPDIDHRVNAGRGEELSERQLQRLRERLDPLYRDLEARGFKAEAPGWWWD